jgi:hypothetical protein
MPKFPVLLILCEDKLWQWENGFGPPHTMSCSSMTLLTVQQYGGLVTDCGNFFRMHGSIGQVPR